MMLNASPSFASLFSAFLLSPHFCFRASVAAAIGAFLIFLACYTLPAAAAAAAASASLVVSSTALTL